MPIRRSVLLVWGACALILSAQDVESQGAPDQVADSQKCTFTAEPSEFLRRAARTHRDAYERTLRFSKNLAAARFPQTAAELPRRNFIDDEILGKIERLGVQPAPLSGDEEFLRRVTLDLTGRTPSVDEIRGFVADTSLDKRDRAIDRLLFSPEFVDKWTMWLGDLVQNAAQAQNRSQQVEGRNRLYEWIRASIDENKSWRDITFELITGLGNNYDRTGAGANFIIRGFHPMGPAQDTYDMLLVRSATMFLGMGHYDCIVCHDGRGHLTVVSAWGAAAKRAEAQRMAAFFSRTRMAGYRTADRTNYYYNSYTVTDSATGRYDLNTNAGNRPRREPLTEGTQTVTFLTPVYRDGRVASGGNWRESFARMIQADPMFQRNFANRVWKAMFTVALAEPVDFLDPLRLDPAQGPPEGWEMQASHPELLEKLARWSKDYDYNLRELLRMIASSTSYQLSSTYPGEWKYEYIPLFARRYPRRLEGEEVHDALLRATGTAATYRVGGFAEPVEWAMRLPEPVEPRSNGAANAFMNSFQRGNRDSQQRSQNASILMFLNLMNSPVVNERVRFRNSPRVQAWAGNPNDGGVVDDMFLVFLSRKPTDAEKAVAVKALGGTTGNARNTAVEDLAWSLVNKVDFLFSY